MSRLAWPHGLCGSGRLRKTTRVMEAFSSESEQLVRKLNFTFEIQTWVSFGLKFNSNFHSNLNSNPSSTIYFEKRILNFRLFLAFGLGTMVYNGLEFGTFFEVPPTSPCYQILQGVNPVLQMIFTFMQMYFIFMNSRVGRRAYRQITVILSHNFRIWDWLSVFPAQYSSVQSDRAFRADARGGYQSLRLDSYFGIGKYQGNHEASSENGSGRSGHSW